MELYKLLLVCLACFALLNFAILPDAKRRWDSNRSLAKIGKASLVGGLSFARTFFLIAAMTYFVVILVIFVHGLSVGATSEQLKLASEQVQGYRAGLATVQKYFISWMALILVMVLAYISYRREKRFIEEQFAKKVEEEKARIQREAEEGKWENLPATPEMAAIVAEIQAAQAAYDAIGSNPNVAPRLSAEREETLRSKIKELRVLWHTADIERRMNIPLDLEGRSAETVRSQSRFGAFFGSKGFVASLKAASRSLSHAGTALLVLSLIGLNATGLDQTLQSQQVHWHDLRVELNQEAVKSSFDKMLKDNPPQDVAAEEDKQEQKDIVNYLARSFETSLARSDVWRDAQRDDDKQVDPFIRSFLVKNQILTEVRSSTSQAYSRRWKNNDGPPPSDGRGGGGDNGPSGGGGGNDRQSGGGGGDERTSGGGGGDDRPSGGGGNERPSVGSSGSAPKDTPPSSPSGGSGPSPAGQPIPEPKPEPIPGPQTSAGIQFAKDLQETLVKRPSLWQRVKAKFRSQVAKLSQPATVADVSETVVSELLGAFAEKGLGADTEVEKLISKVAKSTVKSSSKEAYKVLSQRLMNDLAGDTNLDEAFRKVENLNDKDFPILKSAQVDSFKSAAESVVQSKEYASYVKEHPRALADSPADTVDFKRGVERFKASYDKKRLGIQNEFNAFALYDDIYAGQKDSPESVKSKLVAELSPDTKTGRNIQADYARSRSFADLVGHSNTGGVLIGRAPDESSRAMGFVDLQWVPRDNGLLLILKRKDGKEFTLGPYKPSLVHQALAYVADGRTAAITILNVKDRYQKIFLHPAFLDTQLGSDMIELDQYVFKVMKGNVRYEEAEKRVDAQEMLYLVAWLSRGLGFYLESMSRIESRLTMARFYEQMGQNKAAEIAKLSEAQSEIAEQIRLFETDLSNPDRNKLAAYALTNSGSLLNPDRSILAYKKEFFDQEFVKEIKDCADGEQDLTNFSSCIQRVTRGSISGATEETMKRLEAPPPSIQALSGVRETSFTVDSDLNFLKPTSTSGQLWPLDFTILRAFSSRPQFLPKGQNADAYTDRNPWQFFELNDEIATRVWQKIDSDSRAKSSYQDLRDFTVLQRLFRFALDGKAWSEFPIGKLVDLTRATSGSYEFVLTARWNHPEYGSRKPELFAP